MGGAGDDEKAEVETSNVERRHWDRPDPEPPERVVFWRGQGAPRRGGINSGLPRWEQTYVRADKYQGAVSGLACSKCGSDLTSEPTGCPGELEWSCPKHGARLTTSVSHA